MLAHYRVAFCCILWLGMAAGARGGDPYQKLRQNGAEVYYADLDPRAASVIE